MQKRGQVYALLILLACFSCSQEQSGNQQTEKPTGFTLNGSVQGIPDGTWLYLKNALTDKPIDSAMVKDGRFTMSGKTDGNPVQGLLSTKDFRQYKFLWLENAEMTFRANADKFREAKITGSRTQQIDDAYNALMQPIGKQIDSLGEILYAKSLPPKQLEQVRKQFIDLEQAEKDANFRFISEHPASPVSAHLLSVYSSTWGKQASEQLFGKLSKENQQSPYGQRIANYIKLNKDLKVGDQYADFSQVNPAGKSVKLSDFTGQYVLLEFWASWCGPCREENPALVKTYQAFSDKGFKILGVSLDDSRDNWLQAIEKDRLPWENVSDLKGGQNEAALMYGISGIPNNFLISPEGKIIDRNLRGEKLRKRLHEVFK